ncbi:hypothetical protein [Flavobacterium sp.]|jgi:hypothetical protein|uniref:hypothetical protein n=1 Tax=Flavobacterium sp. TaxID=239 RepID=UPI0037C08ADF
MKDSLTIKALKYIAQRNGEFKPVEIKQLLLDNFPEKRDMAERIEMQQFVKFLEKSDFIEFISEEGLWFIQIAGRKIPRNEISAYVKITSKGFDKILENDRNKKNSFSFYLSIFLGLTSLLFVILNHSNEEDLKTTQMELNAARDSLTIYMLKNNKLKIQYEMLKELDKEK